MIRVAGSALGEHILRLDDRLITWRRREGEGDEFISSSGGTDEPIADASDQAPGKSGKRAAGCNGFLNAFWDLDPTRDEVDEASGQLGQRFIGIHRFGGCGPARKEEKETGGDDADGCDRSFHHSTLALMIVGSYTVCGRRNQPM